MSQRPGLLFIIPSLAAGGAEKQLITLINHLDKGRFRLYLVYLKRIDQLLPHLRGDALDDLLCIDVANSIDPRALRRLREFIATREIDAIVCTNAYATLYGYLARGRGPARPKLVTTFHTTLLRTTWQKAQMLFYRYLFRRCDLLLYVSENQRRFWRERDLRASSDAVVHNGIDVDFFTHPHVPDDKAELRRRFGFAEEDYVVGLCALLRPEKMHTDLVRAVARLRSQGVPAKALLIGDGPERFTIERVSAELGVAAHVRITGLQGDIRPYIAICDVMTIVSHFIETFSLAALESMSLGKPLVMSDIGGASEQVIHGRNGFLFEPGDINGMASHLQCLTSAALRIQMGTESARRVREHFTVEGMTSNFTQRITQLLGMEDDDQGRKQYANQYGCHHEHA